MSPSPPFSLRGIGPFPVPENTPPPLSVGSLPFFFSTGSPVWIHCFPPPGNGGQKVTRSLSEHCLILSQVGLASLRKCVGDFCRFNFGGFCQDFLGDFSGPFSHKNEKKDPAIALFPRQQGLESQGINMWYSFMGSLFGTPTPTCKTNIVICRSSCRPQNPQIIKLTKKWLENDFPDPKQSDPLRAQKWLKSDLLGHFQAQKVTFESFLCP